MVGSQTGQSVISGIADVIRTSGSKFAGMAGRPDLHGMEGKTTGQAIQNTLKGVAGNFGPTNTSLGAWDEEGGWGRLL